MPSTSRPVGLTVLAGVFLVIAAYDVVGTLLLGVAFWTHLDPSCQPGFLAPDLLGTFRAAPLWYLALALFVLWPVKIGLLVSAALGFLAQKRRARALTNLYVAVSLLESAVTGFAMGADIRALVGALFPVFAFLFVNKVFAEDLTH